MPEGPDADRAQSGSVSDLPGRYFCVLPMPEQHLAWLEQVLERFRKVNKKLKPSKCCLMQVKSFLEHVITGKGIAKNP